MANPSQTYPPGYLSLPGTASYLTPSHRHPFLPTYFSPLERNLNYFRKRIRKSALSFLTTLVQYALNLLVFRPLCKHSSHRLNSTTCTAKPTPVQVVAYSSAITAGETACLSPDSHEYLLPGTQPLLPTLFHTHPGSVKAMSIHIQKATTRDHLLWWLFY